MAAAWASLTPALDGGGLRLGGARRGIGAGVGFGRQDIEHDLGAVLEIVIAGIRIGLEFHHGAVAFQMPGGVLDPGRLEARDGRQVGLRPRLEFDGHFAGAGKYRVRNIFVPVEHQPGEIGIGAGAQHQRGQGGDIHRLGRGRHGPAAGRASRRRNPAAPDPPRRGRPPRFGAA